MHNLTMQPMAIHEVLKKLITFNGLSVTELSRKISVSQATIQRIAAGTYKNPHYRTLKLISDYFCVTINQLKGLEPIPFLFKREKTLHNVPLLSREQVLDLSNAFPKQNTESIICDIRVSEKAFAMYMPDTSMEPLISKGSTLLIEPAKTPHHRSYILVKISDHPEAIIRQLIMNSKNKFIKPLSPDLDQFRMNILTDTDSILGVILQVRINCEEY